MRHYNNLSYILVLGLVLCVYLIVFHRTSSFRGLLAVRSSQNKNATSLPASSGVVAQVEEDAKEGGGDKGGGAGNKSTGAGGFFGFPPPNDDQDWGQVSCPIKKLRDVEDFYRYIYYAPLACDKRVLAGGQRKTHAPHLEGAKWVCMSDHINLQPGHCLVYSFGISHDFTFDDDMDNKFLCEVHSFDPTNGLKTHNRTKRLTFHALGLSDVSNPQHPQLRVERYSNILHQLGHTNATLDYLKIDIEGYELNFFTDMFKNHPNLLKNIKQIGMEVHPGSGTFTKNQMALWRHFQQLECYGFRLFIGEVNPVQAKNFKVNGNYRSCCYEIVWARDKQW